MIAAPSAAAHQPGSPITVSPAMPAMVPEASSQPPIAAVMIPIQAPPPSDSRP